MPLLAAEQRIPADQNHLDQLLSASFISIPSFNFNMVGPYATPGEQTHEGREEDEARQEVQRGAIELLAKSPQRDGEIARATVSAGDRARMNPTPPARARPPAHTAPTHGHPPVRPRADFAPPPLLRTITTESPLLQLLLPSPPPSPPLLPLQQGKRQREDNEDQPKAKKARARPDDKKGASEDDLAELTAW